MSNPIELKESRFKAVFDALLSAPNGLTPEELAKVTGLRNVGEVRWVLARFKELGANIDVLKTSARQGGRVKIRYRSLAPEVIMVKDGSNGNAPHGKVQAPTAARPVEDRKQTQATDVVFPPAPEIMDLSDMRSGRFEPPEWYDLMLSKVQEHHKHILLKGPPGVGKSRAWEVFAAEQLRPLVNVNADAGLKARQLIGGMTDNGRFEVAEFATAVVNGWLAKIDEINGADPDALLALNSLLAPPYMLTIHGKMYPVHPEFRLCVTYNPGLVGTKPLPDSLKDRFYPIPVQFPSESRLLKMLAANGVDTKQIEVAVMVKFALELSKMRTDRQIRFDVTIRRLLDAWTDLKDGATVYVALRQSVVGAIDDMVDQKKVLDVLDKMVAKS